MLAFFIGSQCLLIPNKLLTRLIGTVLQNTFAPFFFQSMEKLKAKYLLNALLSAIILLASVFCNTYSFHHLTPAPAESIFKNDRGLYQKCVANTFFRQDLATTDLSGFLLFEVGEVKKLEEKAGDPDTKVRPVNGLGSSHWVGQYNRENAFHGFMTGFHCISIKKIILYHSFKLDC